ASAVFCCVRSLRHQEIEEWGKGFPFPRRVFCLLRCFVVGLAPPPSDLYRPSMGRRDRPSIRPTSESRRTMPRMLTGPAFSSFPHLFLHARSTLRRGNEEGARADRPFLGGVLHAGSTLRRAGDKGHMISWSAVSGVSCRTSCGPSSCLFSSSSCRGLRRARFL